MTTVTIILLILILLVLIAFAILGYFFLIQNKKDDGQDNAMLLMQNQLRDLSRVLEAKMGESSQIVERSLQNQFGQSQKLIQDITRELSEVKETGKQVAGFAEELQNLQDILQNPKQRGILGEYYLETVLKNVLPPERYSMQYKF